MILVTGASGFLGKRVCHLLQRLNKKFYPTALSLGTDLRDWNQTEKIFLEVNPDYVINCAAYVGGIQFGYKHSGEIFHNNLLITLNLLKAIKKFQIKRMVNPISNCAYPSKATLFKESEFWDGPLHESVLVYGFARKASWVGSWAYTKQYNIDVVNLILSNMYGPGDHFHEERSHALGALIMKIVNAKKNLKPEVIIWGSGLPVREWLYVDDAAEALIKALDIAPYIDPINIGVGKGISIIEMAKLIAEKVGYDGIFKLDETKPDGAPFKTVDGRLGEKLLSWKPKKQFIQGLNETINWYLENGSI